METTKNPLAPRLNTKFQYNKAFATKLKKNELVNEQHYEKYLLDKFNRNLRNHLMQRGISTSDINIVTEFAKSRVTLKNILKIYGHPMQYIIQCLANNELDKVTKAGASYKTPYLKNGPKMQ